MSRLATPNFLATASTEPRLDLGQLFIRAFLGLLAVTLIGYATFNKSFAYLGAKPIFIGEMCFGLGLLALLGVRRSSLQLTAWLALPVLAFMAWSACRTFPFLGVHGVHALRDGALWGYGAFAFFICAVLIDKPERFRGVVRWYRVFAIAFLIFAPFAMIASRLVFSDTLGSGGPRLPWADVPLIYAKGGDMGVHLAGVFAYVVLVAPLPMWFLLATIPVVGGLMTSSRAAMLAFFTGAFPTFLHRPRHKLGLTLIGAFLVGFIALWVTDFRWAPPGEKREFSAENIVISVKSMLGDKSHEEMHGTKSWRTQWWGSIVDYTVHGHYFWTGKGYGVNLADADGFQVEDDANPLRSPHNGHLTILARSGVPGIALWATLNGVWIVTLGIRFLQCRAARLIGWERVILVIGILGVVFLLNASFDVFLEGPMGGIWYWCVIGVGLAAIHLSRTHPHLLDDQITALWQET
ncbi:MAG: O-antigen ligase family protein [Planctomycetota bacterium]